jgi:hypothetical protein
MFKFLIEYHRKVESVFDKFNRKKILSKKRKSTIHRHLKQIASLCLVILVDTPSLQ